MELSVAYRDDPAGYNMANFLSNEMTLDGDIFRGKYYDLIIIPTPAISADWLEEKYDCATEFFLLQSRHRGRLSPTTEPGHVDDGIS
mgnify:CR=1 FL=1